MKGWRMGWLLLLGAALLLGGCASRKAVEPMAERGMMEGAPAEALAPVAMDTATKGDFSAEVPDVAQRLVVRNASLSVVVDDPERVMASLGQMAEQMGGFVVSSQLSSMRLAGGAEVPRATITFRVPAEKFQEALDAVRQQALRVTNETVSGQDVTEEYIDLQAQLRNLRAAEQQLQKIMEQATRTEDVLQVYRELTNVRGEIERLEGRIRYLEQSAAMSAITVELIPDEAAQPLQIGGWKPKGVAKNAVEALIHTLQALASLLIWLVIYVLPVLLVLSLVFGLPVYGAVRFWRRRAQKSRQSGETAS